MNKQIDGRQIMRVVLGIIGALCIGIAGYTLYGIYAEYKTEADHYNELEDEFVQIPQEGTDNNEPGTPKEWYELISVDVKGLQQKYKNVIGWIYFEDGLISYPIMQTNNNSTYLSKSYDEKAAKSGSIFMDMVNSADFTDVHTIIYGHNMNNLSMFGRLRYYRTQSGYYDDHKYFQVIRGDEILRYEIFAYRNVPVDSFIYQETFTSAANLGKSLLNKSMINKGHVIEDGDKIVTLSTCMGDDDYRFVVSAVLIEKYSLTEGQIIDLEKE